MGSSGVKQGEDQQGGRRLRAEQASLCQQFPPGSLGGQEQPHGGWGFDPGMGPPWGPGGPGPEPVHSLWVVLGTTADPQGHALLMGHWTCLWTNSTVDFLG